MMRESAVLVAEGVGSAEDLHSCLDGVVEDYVPSFEPLIAKKDEAFRKNREALERQLENVNLSRETLIADVKSTFVQLQ